MDGKYIVRACCEKVTTLHTHLKKQSGICLVILCETKMASQQRRLGPGRFLRIHRSTLVNADRIAEMRSFENGDAAIILRDGTELRMSRARRDSIERLTGRL